MASGFLVLSDGRCFARQSHLYMEVLRAIGSELAAAPALQAYVNSMLPGEGDDDIGFAWIRASDQATVPYFLDIRNLTADNQRLFEEAARRVCQAGRGNVVIDILQDLLDRVARKEPPLSRSDWVEVLPATGYREGPGWESSDRQAAPH